MASIGEEIEEGVEPYEDAPFEIPAPSEPARVPVPA